MIIQIKDDNTSKTLSPRSGEMIPDTDKLPKNKADTSSSSSQTLLLDNEKRKCEIIYLQTY